MVGYICNIYPFSRLTLSYKNRMYLYKTRKLLLKINNIGVFELRENEIESRKVKVKQSCTSLQMSCQKVVINTPTYPIFFCKQWMDETLYCMIIIVSNTVCLRSVKFDFLTPSIVILYNFLLPSHTITECINIKSVLSMLDVSRSILNIYSYLKCKVYYL